MEQNNNTLKIGTLLQGSSYQYRIEKVLGQGIFGITYEGVQTGINRWVTIKEFFMEDYCEREDGSSQVTIVGTKGNREKAELWKSDYIMKHLLIDSVSICFLRICQPKSISQ